MSAVRVAITGLGVVSPLGVGWPAFWTGCLEGRSGVGPITLFDARQFPCRVAAEVREPLSLEADERGLDRFLVFALAAARLALRDAGLSAAREAGVVMGTTHGGIGQLQEAHARLLDHGPSAVGVIAPAVAAHMASAALASRLGFAGPNQTVSAACASGLLAIGEAYDLVAEGTAPWVLCGGTDACITAMAVGGFAAMGALTRRNEAPQAASRPFDVGRDGFVLGEGAALLVLEDLAVARARHAPLYAEIIGLGMSADAAHVASPPQDGAGAALAMRRALDDAGLRPEEVDYINAHGTSTLAGDVAETRAIHAVFGRWADRLAVSSTKSMTGHLMGAAGAIETVVCALAIRDGWLPPTINLDAADKACDLDYVPGVARRREVRVALNNSSAFGGLNAVLALRSIAQ